ncbi:type II toxin-antitoxin system VapC family toxin [Aquipuribacter sp. SD81]|uniref:type II toxin-antitoxin system VapC family toxin n=1 Tax=Aquipuribacter sp. SD81 TaxID=3127703 RepID=UPI00301790E6
MRYLLDTHVLLWLLTDEPVESSARTALADPANDVLVSMASLWEIAIEQGLGRLSPPEDPGDAAVAMGFALLGVEPEHVRAVAGLPHHHRDPFDRMLVAQAAIEGLVLVTRDRRLPAYEVPTLLA